MSTLAQEIRPVRIRAGWIVDVAFIVAGSLLIAGLAQLSIRLPFTPVPITGQTLGVLLVAASLGTVRGVASVGLYLVEGAVGLPFFADGQHGVELLYASSATGGYLWGFVVAAAVIGHLAQQGWDRSIGSAIGAMVIGEIIIFTLGVLWLANALNVPLVGAVDKYDDALDFGLYPFVVGDILKVLLAAGALPSAWRFVGRDRRD
ncbi:MAG: biotin transporter BioY [Actinomycetota bacterium]